MKLKTIFVILLLSCALSLRLSAFHELSALVEKCRRFVTQVQALASLFSPAAFAVQLLN